MASNAENFANGIFSRAMSDLYRVAGRSNVRGTLVNDVQVEFCYIMKTMSECPEYVMSKFVAKVENLVAKVAEFSEVLTAPGARVAEQEFTALGRRYEYVGGIWRRASR